MIDDCEIRLGNYKNVLVDVECDSLICDPPYSRHVHSAHNSATKGRLDRAGSELEYEHFNEEDIQAFVDFWHPRTRGWVVVITDHRSGEIWSTMLSDVGRYVFPPIPFIEIGARVRLLGDGPSSWTCFVIVARPKRAEFMKWGALPGAYISRLKEKKQIVGGKPLHMMLDVVEHYSRKGDLICDPCSGSGTTARAARLKGRRFIGSEMSPKYYELSQKRLFMPVQEFLFQEQDLQ